MAAAVSFLVLSSFFFFEASLVVHPVTAAAHSGLTGVPIWVDIPFGDDALVEPGAASYPDDFNLSDPFPNTHTSRKLRHVRLHDAASSKRKPSLVENDLEFVRFDHDEVLKETLEEVGRQNSLGDDQKRLLTRRFAGRILNLLDGSFAFLLHVAPEGLALRTVGPGGSPMHGDPWVAMAHADQNVHGKPINSLLAGLAPWLFHERYSPLAVLNVWMPAQHMYSQPLVLMDTASLHPANRFTYRIYANGSVGGARLNDCWTYTYNESQHWWWHSELHPPAAVVFSTLRTPHTSVSLHGEEALQPLWLSLRRAAQAVLGSSTACHSAAMHAHIAAMERAANQLLSNSHMLTSAPKVVQEVARKLLSAHEALASYCFSSEAQEKSHGIGKDRMLVQHAQAAWNVTEEVARKSVEMRVVAICLSSHGMCVVLSFVLVASAAAIRLWHYFTDSYRNGKDHAD